MASTYTVIKQAGLRIFQKSGLDTFAAKNNGAMEVVSNRLYFNNGTLQDKVVLLTSTDTLTNKTLTSPTINSGVLAGTFTGTSAITATTFTGALVGNASSATVGTTVTTTTKSDSVTYYLAFFGANSSTNQGIDVGPATYNPSTGVITATNFTGAVTGNCSGSAGTVTSFVGAVEEFTGHIVSGSNYTYILDQSAAYGYTINSLIIQTSSGTITAAVKIGATSVTGISAVSVTSSPTTATGVATNTVVANDRITLVLSSNSSAVDISFTMKVTRT